jgi:hypothetical protein
MDILEVVKHSFKKNTYKTVFTFGNDKKDIVIKFKKSMLLKV